MIEFVILCPNCHTPISKGDIYCRQSYVVGEENARELKTVLRDLTELHDRLANILGDCEVWTNE